MKGSLEILVPGFLGVFLISSVFKEYYSLSSKISILEVKIDSLKEKVSDLELFKLKVYSNDVVLGRRAWDEIDDDEDEDED